MMVSRNSPRKNDFDKFAKFPIIEGKNREERKQPRTLLKNPPNKMKNGKTKRHLLFAWVLASVPVFIPQYLSLNFVFCEYLFEGWERELVKFRLPSVFGKGEFSDSSRFWGEGEILTASVPAPSFLPNSKIFAVFPGPPEEPKTTSMRN